MLQNIRYMIHDLAVHEETRIDLLNAVYDAEARIRRLISSVEEKLDYTKSELNAIRKMHEHQPLMPLYDTLPSVSVNVQDNIYDLRVAVQGTVQHDAARPIVALSISESGHPKNFCNKVFVDKTTLLTTKDRESLINHVLQNMYEQMIELFDKEDKLD